MESTECTDIDRLIVEQMADAMIYSDKDGVIRGWNAAAESQLRHPCPQQLSRTDPLRAFAGVRTEYTESHFAQQRYSRGLKSTSRTDESRQSLMKFDESGKNRETH